ncbi:MAG: hypothetical protein JSW27_04260 [Phycisphaerales bacterium]|nr:MAG: hypothetical protein JSW27_04260 [Phycisphaerales bacterium]
MNHMIIIVVSLALAVHSVNLSQTSSTQVQLHPVSPQDRSDGRVSGKINGREARFSYFRNFPTYYYDTNYCRLAADGPVCVDLTIQPEFEKAFLRTLLSDIPYARDGQTLLWLSSGSRTALERANAASKPFPEMVRMQPG